jgi:hypothetical protein
MYIKEIYKLKEETLSCATRGKREELDDLCKTEFPAVIPFLEAMTEESIKYSPVV